MSDGSLLLEDLVSYFNRFVAFSDPAQADVMALWALHTHAIAAFDVTPYLFVTAAGPSSGKSRLMQTMELVVRRPLMAASITPAALYAAIDDMGEPTVMIDEIDTVFGPGTGSQEALRRVLNSGYQRRGGFVLRKGRGKNGPAVEKFPVFGPKAIAGIDNGFLPPTLYARSLVIRLWPALIPVDDFRDAFPVARSLRAQGEAWGENYLQHLREARPNRVRGLENRDFEIAEPLLAVADLAGGDWFERSRDAIMRLVHERPQDPQRELLSDLYDAFGPEDEFLASAELTARIDRPTITQKMLALRLAGLQVTPVRSRVNGKMRRGYWRHQFVKVWDAAGIG